MKQKFVTSLCLISSVALLSTGFGEIKVDAQETDQIQAKEEPSFKKILNSREELFRESQVAEKNFKNKLSSDNIAFRKQQAYTEMSKNLQKPKTLIGKKGESITFKWSDIKIDPSYGKEDMFAEEYHAFSYDSARVELATFGNQEYANTEEAYNQDQSLKVTCKSSSEDPFGVDLTFTVLKEKKDYSTRFTFNNPVSRCKALVVQRAMTTWFKSSGNFTVPGNGFDFDFGSFIKVQPRELRLEANDLTINQGEKFDPFDKRIGLKAIDTYDGDITKQIKVVSNEVNPLIAGAYGVKYQVTNSVGMVATKTITVTVKAHDPWPNGNVDGWKMFSGKDIQLIHDPQNSVLGSGKAFYADEHASIYKHFNGKDSLKKGKHYRVTVYIKPLVGDDLVNHLVKVSLKSDPASPSYRPLINTALSNGTKTIKGYYVLTNTFKVEKGETTPLINVENFKAGYIGSVAIQQID